MKTNKKTVVGISVGDLNGIGPEIILKAYADPRSLELNTPVLFASDRVMNFFKKHFKSKINFNVVNNASQITLGKFNIVNVWKEAVKIDFGTLNTEIGSYAIKSLEAATKALQDGHVDVLVTAPINKQNIQSETFNFPGHTNYLAQTLKGDSLMFMVSKQLRVGLLTDHVPLKDIASHITPKRIEDKIKIVETSLQKDFGVSKPKIAVLAINPHAGDNGVIGNEDDDVLRPTIEDINKKGTLVYGPYSADSFFGSNTYKSFDAILASYHDQGLIPFKTIAFGEGVNYTAGLSHVRTSPDHGTAYDIAGKGEADASSFIAAIDTAIHIFKNRTQFSHYSRNPLQKSKR